jgi:DNA-binding MarR family transcriptional regulator
MIDDPVKTLPGYALRRVSATVMARLAVRLERFQLRPAEATVLLVIGANPGVKQSQIGRLLDIASANMAPLTARLADRGLIIRQAVDGRSQGLRLSEAGRRMAHKARTTMEEVEADLLARIPEDDREGFLRGLVALSGRIDD